MKIPPILFRDERFVVLNKPAGLKVHPGPGGGPSVEDCFPSLSTRRDGPWLAHRLDADTAGCLVIALRRAALHAAQAAFAAGRARKTYWAVVVGCPAEATGVISLPLSRQTKLPGGNQGWRMRIDAQGQEAVTSWRVLGAAGGFAWLALHPRTGRTHQLRVHCAELGWPILGDAVYGAGGGPMHLLARAIAMQLAPPLAAVAPPPEFMEPALRACGWRSTQHEPEAEEQCLVPGLTAQIGHREHG
jgi:tRNA pseudouridine32 synthase/23S rRNA pseudouridine746 synthase